MPTSRTGWRTRPPAKLKVLVAGGHPDDPESGCGGTIARYVDAQERPDVVFTHWPVDTHPDHRAISLLVYDAWMRTGSTAALGYFEVLSGDQTQLFRPTDYVDITSVARRKRDACFAHASQRPEDWYPRHERMSRFRGMEYGSEHAEAFVRHDRGPALPLPA